jgi:hypothetical protein
MSIAAGTTRLGRVQAEALMTSTGVVRRQTGTTEDPVTFETVPVYETIYTGKGRLKLPSTSSPGTGEIPGAIIIETRAILSLPIEGSGAVLPNDVWEFTTNPLDTSLVGRQLRLTGAHAQTYATARRFPAEWVN